MRRVQLDMQQLCSPFHYCDVAWTINTLKLSHIQYNPIDSLCLLTEQAAEIISYLFLFFALL